MSAQARQVAYPMNHGRFRLLPGRWLVALAALMFGALIYWAVQQLLYPMNVPVDKIRVQGSFVHVNEAMLAPLSKQVTGVGYFDIDVSALQQQVETLPWIKQATVRRIWPDTLAIHFIERQPVAVWANGGLLSGQGILFTPERNTYPDGLPLFDGPDKLSEHMLQAYQRFSKQLTPLGLTISELRLDKRKSWQVVLHNGLQLKLGREHEYERLDRFVQIYPKLAAMDKGHLQHVDLRYTNGMAVRWQANKA